MLHVVSLILKIVVVPQLVLVKDADSASLPQMYHRCCHMCYNDV